MLNLVKAGRRRGVMPSSVLSKSSAPVKKDLASNRLMALIIVSPCFNLLSDCESGYIA